MKLATIFALFMGLGLSSSSSVAFAQVTQNPYATDSTYTSSRFPRVDIGFLNLCAGVFPGIGDASYMGYCPNVRLRFVRKLGVTLDPVYVSANYRDRNYGMFGLRPGIQFSLLEGTGALSPSTAYVLAGMDLWIPTTSRAITPSVFLGGHMGIGAMLAGKHWGLGAEIRAIVRRGVGNQDNALTNEMSTVRFGFEVRTPTLFVAF